MMESIRTRCLCTTFAMVAVLRCATSATAQTFTPDTFTPQTPRAFAELFQNTLTDFRNLATRDTVTMLAVITPMDRRTTGVELRRRAMRGGGGLVRYSGR